MTPEKEYLRTKLRDMSERKRREFTHAMIDHHIGAASGCYTLLDILLLSCNIDALHDALCGEDE